MTMDGWTYVRTCKRPRRGEYVDAPYGPSLVEQVRGPGMVIEVVDRIGRRWTVERVPAGWWTVVAPPADAEL